MLNNVSRIFSIVLTYITCVSSEFHNLKYVGVYAHVSNSDNNNCKRKCNIIERSIVDWIEDNGDRIVPITHDASIKYYDYIIPKISALILPGGDWGYPTNPEKLKYIVDKTIDFKKPILSICTGFQYMMNYTSNSNILESNFDSVNWTIPLSFVGKSKFINNMTSNLIDIFNKPTVINKHTLALTPINFFSNNNLKEQYEVVATQEDRNNISFIAIVENENFLGLQFHPELNAYEFGSINGIPYEAINHRQNAVLASNYISRYFMNMTDDSTYNNLMLWDINHFSITRTGPEYQWSYFIHNNDYGPIRNIEGIEESKFMDNVILAFNTQELKSANLQKEIDELKESIKLIIQ